MRKASIVIGTMFGDEGKGLVTDYLCAQDPNSIVVRFSGGQQAGHNVVIGDKTHIHSNYGSGTLRGIPSYFTEHTTAYLASMARELEKLNSKGVEPKLSLNPLVRLTTPYDVALNRIREMRDKVGSVGLGVGATMERTEKSGYKLYAIDLLHRDIFLQKLKGIKEYTYAQVPAALQIAYDQIIEVEMEAFMKAVDGDPMFNIVGYAELAKYQNLIFEGSQGILLDQDHGIFPNVTYSRTTSKNAALVSQLLGAPPEIYYVTRCYQTRHGNGWMSNQDPITLSGVRETNVTNEHQGEFKIGEFDYDLLNYALAIDNIYSANKVKNLVVTCLDHRPDFNFDSKKVLTKFEQIYLSSSPDSYHLKNVEF